MVDFSTATRRPSDPSPDQRDPSAATEEAAGNAALLSKSVDLFEKLREPERLGAAIAALLRSQWGWPALEAVRAGAAGRGFTVVAQEVKQLAHQTVKATSEISAQIELIQEQTQAAVVAVNQIDKIIRQLNSARTASSAAQDTAAAD